MRRPGHHLLLAAVLAGATASLAAASGSEAVPKDETEAAAMLRPQDVDAAGTAARVSPEVLGAAGRLIVKFEDGVSARDERVLLRSADVDVEEQVAPLDLSVVEVAPRDVPDTEATLEASPHVEYVERDALVRALEIPNDELWRLQWGLKLVGIPEVWEVAAQRAVVPVAVIDTGIDAGHPDLAGVVGEGIDLVNGDADASDDHGHGTAAAGVIAARADNAIGGAGVCRACTLIPIKVLDGAGAGTTSTVAQAVVWAVDRGARVINLSLGSRSPSQALSDAVAYAASRGVVVVAAAGNEGTSDPFYPAADPGAVSVGATMPDDALYEWSNRGPWVRLAAPGCNTAPARGGGFESFCGTSSAAPVVAGLAAVAIAQQPSASLAAIEDALNAGVVEVPNVARGRVDARGTLAALGAPVTLEPPVVPPASRFLRASLPTRAGVRTFPQRTGEGRVRIVIRAGTPRLALTVLDARGRVVGRATNRRLLAVTRSLEPGAYRIVVRGRPGTGFTLSVTYPRTPKEVSAWLALARK